MATKITVDCATGAVTEVTMAGAELAAFSTQRLVVEPPLKPLLDRTKLQSARQKFRAASTTADKLAALSDLFDALTD